MNVVILNGASGSRTDPDLAACRVAERLEQAGAEVRHFILRSHDIGHCLGDFDCWIRTPGRCRIRDEGQEIERAVHDADLVVMTTTVSFGAYGATLKKATDRLIPLILPFFAKAEGLTHHARRYDRLPKFAAIGFGPAEDAIGAELFRALVESQALNLGASAWIAAVLPDLPVLTDATLAALLEPVDAPANPSGSAAAATARLIREISADPGDKPFASRPRVAILVGSARPEGKSTSLAIARYLAERCGPATDIVMAATFARRGDAAARAARQLADADVLIVVAPLYVDALPYLALLALEKAAAARLSDAPVQRIAGIINCGFPEPEHTRFAFGCLRAFARATGGHFAGGLPVGGGEIIHGRDLNEVGPMAAALRNAIDAAAAALVNGHVIPDDVSLSLAKPAMPPALYRLAGSMGWRFQGLAKGMWPSTLKARPFDAMSDAEWEAEMLRGAIKARPLRVVAKHAETEDAVTILLEDPAHDPISYCAGQYVTLEIEVNGVSVRRAYSLASTPEEPGLAITVKRVAGGLMSNHLHDDVAVGDIIRCHGPSGSFTPRMTEGQFNLLLIGGGSGIVPLQAIARSQMRSESGSRVTLVYGASSRARAIYGDALEGLAQEYGSRFALQWVFETPDPSAGAATGRLDEAGAGAILSGLDLASLDRIMICGPDPMRESVRAMLARRGVEPDRIVEESFASPRTSVVSADPQEAVLITEEGERRTIPIMPGQSLLDAALDAGEAIGFSCMSGGCGACLVTIAEGLDHVALDEPNVVAPAACNAGMVPACITRLSGPVAFRVGQASSF